MGIRIHKMMGWGLTDVVTDEDGQLADPRINANSLLLRYEIDDRDSMQAYCDWLKEQQPARGRFTMPAKWILEPKGGRLDIPSDCVVHQSEFGLASVLCVRPPGYLDWERRDDTMDWMEESYGHGQQNRVVVYDDGIWPYLNYMNAETGERLKDVFPWVRLRNDKAALSSEEYDLFAEMAGFSSHEEALRLVVPDVPEDIRMLVRFGELFTEPDVALQLRPMIYVYWS